MIHAVSVLNDLDTSEVQEWNDTKLFREFEKIKHQLVISGDHSKTITIEGHVLEFVDFKTLALGQWIDLESMVSDDFNDNLPKIAASIYLKNSGGGMNSDNWETYGGANIPYRAKLIGELPAVDTLGACMKYLSFRENLFKSYDIFEEPLENVDTEELNNEELELYNQELKLREEGAKNQWEKLLNALTHNDVTKFNDVLAMNLFLCLNQVTYLKSLKK